MTNELWWYVARSCGIVGWALLGSSVLWGLAVSGRVRSRVVTPAWLLDLHRHLGGLAIVFVALHLVGLLGDKYIHFGPAALLVPLASTWRPGAVAWGVVALYLLVAVEVTSLARRALPRRIWRATHFLSFPLFAFSTVHLLQAGTDARQAAVRVAALVVGGLVAVATGSRMVSGRRRSKARAEARAKVRTAPIRPAGHEVMAPGTRPTDRFQGQPVEAHRDPATRRGYDRVS